MVGKYTGGCLCGASKYAFDNDAKFAIRCYCRDCQQVSGGGHLPQIGVSGDTFTASGPIKTWSRKSDEGNDLRFSFCGDCGSPLFKTTSKMPDLRFVTAGTLDQMPEIKLTTKVFESSRAAWDEG